MNKLHMHMPTLEHTNSLEINETTRWLTVPLRIEPFIAQ